MTLYDRSKVYDLWGIELTGGGRTNLTRAGCQNTGYERIYGTGGLQICAIYG